LNLQLRSGERLGITGPNGTGKTTLLRTLLGEMPPMSGSFVLAGGVKIGYYAQTSVQLDPENDLVAEIRSVCPSFSELQARSYLALSVSQRDVFKKIALLSGGEQSRAAGLLILSAGFAGAR
jgi:ATP-binding cassette subfamily F protein 3